MGYLLKCIQRNSGVTYLSNVLRHSSGSSGIKVDFSGLDQMNCVCESYKFAYELLVSLFLISFLDFFPWEKLRDANKTLRIQNRDVVALLLFICPHLAVSLCSCLYLPVHFSDSIYFWQNMVFTSVYIYIVIK